MTTVEQQMAPPNSEIITIWIYWCTFMAFDMYLSAFYSHIKLHIIKAKIIVPDIYESLHKIFYIISCTMLSTNKCCKILFRFLIKNSETINFIHQQVTQKIYVYNNIELTLLCIKCIKAITKYKKIVIIITVNHYCYL